MKSASSTASGSGQHREKRPIPDGKSRMQVKDMSETGTGKGTALPAAPSANTRRRIVVKSEQMAVTTQEAVDGYREKAMRIASVEHIELGNMNGVVNHGSGIQMGKKSEPLWRSVVAQS